MEFNVKTMTLKYSLGILKELDLIDSSDDVSFDFSMVKSFEPLAMLLVGSKIRKIRKEYSEQAYTIINKNASNISYAGTMGFFKYISSLLSIGKEPGEANGSGNYIPITKLEIEDLRKTEIKKGNFLETGEIVENEANRLASVVDRGNRELHNILTYLIREIVRNTPEHANTNTVWICGQYWEKSNVAEIAIMDEGIGIYESLKKNKTHSINISDNESAIQWAIKPGVSEVNYNTNKKRNNIWENSGYGLYMVKEICKKLKGTFCLVSYGNYILCEQENSQIGKTSFNGTAIQIRVDLNNVINANRIINEISLNGQKEAKGIATAIKTASVPSKGLIHNK